MGVTGMLAAANGLRHTDPLAELLGLRIGCDSTSRDRSCRLPDRPNPRWKGEDSADLTRRQHGYRSATQIAVGPGSPDVPFSGPGRAHRRYDAHVLPHPVDRPLVFLDVDGPLIPFKARPAGEISPDTSPDGGGNPLLDRLDPEDGRRLLALGCPLIWATTWGADANEIICPRLGCRNCHSSNGRTTTSRCMGCTGRPGPSPGGPPGTRSSGSTTRSPTRPAMGGCPSPRAGTSSPCRPRHRSDTAGLRGASRLARSRLKTDPVPAWTCEPSVRSATKRRRAPVIRCTWSRPLPILAGGSRVSRAGRSAHHVGGVQRRRPGRGRPAAHRISG